MVEIGLVSILFLLSLTANALITKWSAKKVLGLEVSLIKSCLIVAGRSLAALLAGFAVGYSIRLCLQGDVAHRSIQLAGMAVVSLLSFFSYWVLLGKMTNASISFLGMTKTIVTEFAMLLVAGLGIAIALSVIFYTT